MGRKIRRVPPNWKHPKTDRYGDGRYQPIFDEEYDLAAQRWMKELSEWKAVGSLKYYWEYAGNPPNPIYYRTYTDEEATWFQVYETVSEGTPVTPPFETQDELVEYLCARGDFWDQERGDKPWDRLSAESFVRGGGRRPSMIVFNGSDGIKIQMPKDQR